MLLQIALQILMPAVVITILWRTRHSSKLKWFTDTLLFFLALLFAFVTGRWDETSLYLRYLLFPLLAFASILAFRRITLRESSPSLMLRLRDNAANILLIGFLSWLNISILTGYRYPGEAVNLSYPLRDGFYYVGGGGSSRWINDHHAFPPEDYALDINGLSSVGHHVRIGAKTDLERYPIFGAPIFSPCDGTVLTAVDGYPDQIPPNKDTVNIAGNYVLLACQDVEIVLAHMQEGTVEVTEGDTVIEGQVIGAVGNSGQTTQPHLHIHAERGGPSGKIFDGHGVPMTFNNRFLVRNSVFTGGDR